MPKLEVRLTERQMERLRADAAQAGMTRSDYVRWRCLAEEPNRQAERNERERGIRQRARAVTPTPRSEPKPSASEPFLTPQMVAMQGAVTYARAEELIREGRVRLDNGHLLVDDRPV